MSFFSFNSYLNVRYVFATFAFVIAWYGIVLSQTVETLSAGVRSTLLSQATQIEEDLRHGDSMRVLKTLWPLSANGIVHIQINPSLSTAVHLGTLESQTNEVQFQIKNSFDLLSNGLKIAEVNFSINTLKIATNLVIENAGVYGSMIIFMLSMLVFVNEKTSSSLKALEERVVSLGKTSLSLAKNRDQITIDHLANSVSSKYISPACAKSIRQLILAMDNYSKSQIELRSSQAIVELATQVSHDIRSPLSALNMVIKQLDNVQESQKNIIQAAAERINDIANDLLTQHKTNYLSPTDHDLSKVSNSQISIKSTLIADLLRSLFMEKQTAWSHHPGLSLKLDLSGPEQAACELDAKEFTRALSNLVNNAVESLEQSGSVTLALRTSSKEVTVIVSDDGRGISEEILIRLGKEKVSYGKENSNSGSGLGVFHARSAIEAMGGKFHIQSRVGVGTQVTMTFPRVG